MKTDIREKTGCIVKKGNEYLIGTICYSTQLRWSNSPYDAWFTRDVNKAEKVAAKVGGEVVIFNPVVRQMMVFVR